MSKTYCKKKNKTDSKEARFKCKKCDGKADTKKGVCKPVKI